MIFSRDEKLPSRCNDLKEEQPTQDVRFIVELENRNEQKENKIPASPSRSEVFSLPSHDKLKTAGREVL